MSLKKIDARIAMVTTNGAKLNDYVHVTAMMIVNHAKAHGDTTRALALVKAMPASMRRTMLVAWLAKYTPIAVSIKNDAVGFNAKYQALKTPEAKAKAWDLDGAMAEPFHALADKVPEEKDYDIAALINMVRTLSKRITTKLDDGKVAANDADKAKALVASLDKIAA